MDLSKRPDHEAPMDLTNSNPLWMWEVVFSMTKGPPVTRELRILDIDHENCSILLSGIKRGVMDQNSASRRFKNELLIQMYHRSYEPCTEVVFYMQKVEELCFVASG